MTDEAFPDALPVGYRLHWYRLEHVLGQGGFGITHLAHDTNLDRRVAIKEYLPTDFARRRSDATVRPSTEANAERYGWGLGRFLDEARTLARFDHPNIVRVVSVFEANNTAYMVMRFEEGESLSTLLERRGTLAERALMDCLLPILDGLELVHTAGFIHRDIKPENIYVRNDGSPVLLDFGSARQSFGRSKTMTILVAPGYAPLEQYYGDPETQGPWTDIYSLGATCYRAITGRAPLDAIVRAKGVLGSTREILPPAVELGRGRYGERLLAAVDHALQLSERDRPQSIAEWRRELVAPALVSPLPPPAPEVAAATTRPAPPPTPDATPRPERRRSAPVSPLWQRPVFWGWAGAAGALAAGAALLVPARRTVPDASPSMSSALVSPPTSAASAVASEAPRLPAATLPVPPKVATLAPAPSPAPARETQTPPRPPAPKPTVASPSPAPTVAMVAPPPSTAAPMPLPPTSAVAVPAPVAVAATPRDNAAARRARDDQLDAAEAALRRGEHAAAADMLAPWAATGVPRAQVLLGRAKEAHRGRQQSDFEAYVWYGVAARGGEPGAQAMKEKVAGRLQPAEVHQADQVIERWKPRNDPSNGAAP